MKESTEKKIRTLLAQAREDEKTYIGMDKFARDSDSYLVDALAPYFEEDETGDNSLDNGGGIATI